MHFSKGPCMCMIKDVIRYNANRMAISRAHFCPGSSGPGTRGLLARPLSSGVQKERDYAK